MFINPVTISITDARDPDIYIYGYDYAKLIICFDLNPQYYSIVFAAIESLTYYHEIENIDQINLDHYKINLTDDLTCLSLSFNPDISFEFRIYSSYFELKLVNGLVIRLLGSIKLLLLESNNIGCHNIRDYRTLTDHTSPNECISFNIYKGAD